MSLTPEQMAIRATGLTATDMVKLVLGRDSEVYAAKVGLADAVDDNTAMRMGRIAEPLIAQAAAEDLGVRLEGDGRETVRHTPVGWALATPDRFILDEAGKRAGLLEIKAVGRFAGRSWAAEGDGLRAIPTPVAVQLAWQMAVTGLAFGYAAGFGINGVTDPQYRRITREECAELEKALWIIGETFWTKHVEPRIPPPPDGSDAAHALLAKTFPSHSDEWVKADVEADAIGRRLADLRAQRKTADRTIALLEQQLCERIGLKEGIEGSGWRMSWKLRAEHVRKAQPAKTIAAARVARFTADTVTDEENA